LLQPSFLAAIALSCLQFLGVSVKGDGEGLYIRIDNDSENTGGFLILTNPDHGLRSNMGHGNWVENEECLERLFAENYWTIEWNTAYAEALIKDNF
jgi:hypothetical protein